MTALEAAVLGLVQGLFMFIPVSSTSHLALTQHLMGAAGSTMPAPDSPEMILFDIVVHVGTLVSIVVVMWSGLAKLVTGIGADLRTLTGTRRWHGLEHLRLAWLGMITVAVTGVLGLAVRAVGTDVFGEPALIAAALLITGGILWWTDTAGPRVAAQNPRGPTIPAGLSLAMVPIRRFAAAVESGDVQQIKDAYPGLTSSQQKGWETVFKQWKPESAEIRDVRGVPSSEAGITVVELVMAVNLSDRTTKTTVAGRPSRYQARLKREGLNAVLLSLTDVTNRR
jgi:hypothetical protein